MPGPLKNDIHKRVKIRAVEQGKTLGELLEEFCKLGLELNLDTTKLNKEDIETIKKALEEKKK